MNKSEIEEVVEAATVDNNEDSNSEEEFVDADDDNENNDLTRPSEWTPKEDTEVEKDCDGPDGVETDSTGCVPTSPDYVDEAMLESWEKELTEEEKEQKRLEANQYKMEGNNLHKEGKHLEACDKYTQGLRVCPLAFKKDRSILYANRGAMKKVLGLPEQAIQNCTKAIDLDPQYLKALVRRAQLYEEVDKLEDALKDFQSVVEIDPRHFEANAAVRRLPPKIEEKNEKMKQEMFDNLKKLGNMVLNPFGLSTDNFKMEQNAETGGYNIQFQQNK